MSTLEAKDLSHYLEKSVQDGINQFPKLTQTVHQEDGIFYPVIYIGKRCHPDDVERCAKEIATTIEYLYKNNHIKGFLGPGIFEVALINERAIVSYMAVDGEGEKYIKDNSLSFEPGEVPNAI